MPSSQFLLRSIDLRSATRRWSCVTGLAFFVSCTENPTEHFRADEITVPNAPDHAPGSDDAEDGDDDRADDAVIADASVPADSSVDDEAMGSSAPSATSGASSLDGGESEADNGGSLDSSVESDDVASGDDTPSDDEPSIDAGSTTPVDDPNPLPDETSLLASCGAAPVSNQSFTRSRLRSSAAECATWHYCRFESFADVLDERVAAHVSAPSDTSLERARQAWQAAMSNWSAVELFQFGPLGSRADSAGKDMYEGQGIRDLIYAWPTVSRCRVEEQLLSQNYASRGLDGSLISGRGLYALEYLLFYEGSDTACSGSAATSWASLSSSQVDTRKREYAAALSADVLSHTRALIDLWAPEGGNFRDTFVNAEGEYPDEQEVLKVIAWSLVYVEREVKDWKLGIPAGYTISHPVTTPEAPHALTASQNLVANLEGFQRLFQGCGDAGEGIGFDDWLIEAGHNQLAQDMTEALANARAAAEAFPPLHEASPQEIDDLYQAVRELTNLLKNEFFGAGSPLNLDLPGGVEGDTD